VFAHVGQLAEHPDSSAKPAELKGWRYRQIVEPPCRVFYRHENGVVYVLHVIRAEHQLRKRRLAARGKPV